MYVLCDYKITFIAMPSGECLLVVAVVSTLHLFDPVALTFNLLTSNETSTRTCHVLSTCQVWWRFVLWFLFLIRLSVALYILCSVDIRTHIHAHIMYGATECPTDAFDYVGAKKRYKNKTTSVIHHTLQKLHILRFV